jgi:protein TonB
MAGVVVGLLLMTLVGWLSWRHTAVEINASAATIQPISAPAESGKNQPEVPSRTPAPSITVHQSDRLRTKDLLRNAAEIGPDVSPTAQPKSIQTRSTQPKPTQPRPAEKKAADSPFFKDTADAARPTTASNETPPSIAIAAGTPPENLLPVASATATIPSLGAAVSQGVVEAKLVRKIDPVYPVQARKEGLTGSVVLDAIIGQDGSVKGVKVIEGQPTLSASAASAVRQWKFSPAILNGKAIEAQKRITVVFKLP